MPSTSSLLSLARGLRAAGLLLVVTTGCVMTREEGQQLQSDVAALQRESADARAAEQRRLKALEERLAKAETTLDHIGSLVEKTDQQGRRTDADFFLKMDELGEQMRKLSGSLDTINHRLDELEGKIKAGEGFSSSRPGTDGSVASVEPAHGSAPPAELSAEEKQKLYDEGKKAFDEGKYDEARKLFRKFLQHFPADAMLADNALFWVGESHFKESSYDKAILTFQEVVNKYPASDKLDASLYKIGRSFEALGLKEDAALFYDDLVSKFPSSSLVKDAQKRLAALKKSSPAKKPKGKR